jgi:hypothetical protein
MRARTKIALALSLLALYPVTVRADWDGRPLSSASTLPRPFSFATASDALGATYSSYVKSLGTVRALRTRDGRAAHVSILEARPWYVNRSPYLVVAVARRTDEDVRRRDLCGACRERFAIAVLAERAGKLHLVARTHDDGPAEAESGEVLAFLSVKGDGAASLDLAPYRLSRSETLIGVRNTWSVTGGSFGTNLVLFRIVGRALKAVANIRVGAGTFWPKRTLDHSTIALARGRGLYYDLHVLTRHYEGPPGVNLDYSYDPQPGSRPVSSDITIFRFDGSRYREIASGALRS